METLRVACPIIYHWAANNRGDLVVGYLQRDEDQVFGTFCFVENYKIGDGGGIGAFGEVV